MLLCSTTDYALAFYFLVLVLFSVFFCMSVSANLVWLLSLVQYRGTHSITLYCPASFKVNSMKKGMKEGGSVLACTDEQFYGQQ